MKINLLKYFLFFFVFLFLVIFYLSVIGIETKKFNNQITEKVIKIDKNLNIKLDKIKLTLDPINFKINAKTIGSLVLYKKRPLELEYIKIQISLTSFIKNKITSSNIKISSRSLLFTDFITFVRAIKDTPQLFIFQKTIKKGHIIFDLNLNFDERGNVKDDYQLKGVLKDLKINFFNQNIYENINFNFNLKKNNYLFEEIKLQASKVTFNSKTINIKKIKNNYLAKGVIENEKSILNKNFLKLLNLESNNLDLKKANFTSKNKFFLEIDNKLNVKNFELNSDLSIDQLNYNQKDLLKKYLPKSKKMIILRDQKIKLKYLNNELFIKGKGKIKLENNFDDIKYSIRKKDDRLTIISNINFDQLILKKNKNLKNIFPKINDQIILKDQKINLEYKNKNLLISGDGKIKLDKKLENINYIISKKNKKFNFDLNLNLTETKFQLSPLNYQINKKSKALLKINANYQDGKEIIINNFSILEKNNVIKISNLILDESALIIQVDEVNFDYFDIENKQNKLILKKLDKFNYELNGLNFNANTLITQFLNEEDKIKNKIFKNNISLNLKIEEVFIDKIYFVKNLDGNLFIKNNKINSANFSANFKDKGNIVFSIATNDIGNKITKLSSSWAKPLVNRYKFIKGFDEGNLEFVSYKKNGISNSKLIIDNFKVKEVPALAKLLSLASLQGIADLLTGEGLRFTDFEMNFTNEKNLMKIEEIYAIGPSISILLEGYLEKDKLVSLRGTLVPATTINRTIASIPLIGDFLVGKKVGEGVFGVSFKIKGPPKNLETTVNPIKTLTPRFITRTLDKIKN